MSDLMVTAAKGIDFRNKNIETITDSSDSLFTRIHVKFKNGLVLSIVTGPFNLGAPGTYEVAILDATGKWHNIIPELITDEDLGDIHIIGNLSVTGVNELITKVSNLEPENDDGQT